MAEEGSEKALVLGFSGVIVLATAAAIFASIQRVAAQSAVGIRSLELRTALRVTVFVENGLTQPVQVQVKGNRTYSVSGAVDIGLAFSVAALSSEARTLSAETSGWLPYLFVVVSCLLTPTDGELSIYLVKDIDVSEVMVDALSIRDTLPKDPEAEPGKIFIVNW